IDRQRYAVERDRALGGDMRCKRGRRRDGDLHAVTDGLDRHHVPDRIDVTGDDMPAELVANAQGALKVEAPPRIPHVGRGARQRLGARIDGKPASGAVAAVVDALVDNRETGARTGDRCAKVDRGDVITGIDYERSEEHTSELQSRENL